MHRAQPHLGEMGTSTIAPGLVVAAIILLTIVVGLLLYVWVGQAIGPKLPSATVPSAGPLATIVTATLAPVTTASHSATPGGSPTRTATRVPATPTLVPASPTSAQPARTTYLIKPGDTLLGIALKYGVTVQAIMKANGLKTETIRIGDELIIPLPTPTPR